MASRAACRPAWPCGLACSLREPRAGLGFARPDSAAPPPPSAPFGSARSRMKDFGERNETRGGALTGQVCLSSILVMARRANLSLDDDVTPFLDAEARGSSLLNR